MSDKTPKGVFETYTGRTIKICPVSPFLIEKLRGALDDIPDPPTYKAEVGIGDGEVEFQEFPHDEKTEKTPEQQEEWDAYLAQVEEQQSERTLKMFSALAIKGVVGAEPTNEWKEEMKFLDVDLPENPAALRNFYIQTELLTHATDIIGLVSAIMEVSGVSKEAVESLRRSFRDEMAESDRDTTPAS
jgi:hypothetical protein